MSVNLYGAVVRVKTLKTIYTVYVDQSWQEVEKALIYLRNTHSLCYDLIEFVSMSHRAATTFWTSYWYSHYKCHWYIIWYIIYWYIVWPRRSLSSAVCSKV